MITRRRLLTASALMSAAGLAGSGGALILQPGTAFAAGLDIDSLGSPLQDVLLIGGTVATGPYGIPVLWSASSGEPARLNAVEPRHG